MPNLAERARFRAEKALEAARLQAERRERDARVWAMRRERRAQLAEANRVAASLELAQAGDAPTLLRQRLLEARAASRLARVKEPRRPVPGAPCTASTRRCPEGGDPKRATPACCVAHMATLLRRTGSLLDAAGVPWWIDYGMLLGYCVSGGAESGTGKAYWNDKDVDVCALTSDRDKVLATVVPALKAAGHDVKYYGPRPGKWEWGDVVKVRLSATNQNNLDLTFWERKPDGILDRKNWAHTDQFKGRELHEDRVFPTVAGLWEGVPVPVPAQALWLVEHRYGAGWRTLRAARHGNAKTADPKPPARRRRAGAQRRSDTLPRPDSARRVAVIMAAYRAQDWILEALDAVAKQQLPAGWHLEVRVGVDGCQETSRRLREAGVGHWFSEANVGAYVMRNSLVATGPADCYAVFDSDDIMLPGYLASLAPAALRSGMSGSGRVTFLPDGKEKGRTGYHKGVTVFADRAWRAIGGFRSWRIAADWDAVLRAEALGYRVSVDRRPLYRRRRHGESLTRAKDTAIGSPKRKALERESARLIRERQLTVRPETVTLLWRAPAT